MVVFDVDSSSQRERSLLHGRRSGLEREKERRRATRVERERDKWVGK
jgi:hypothetical protein